MAAGDSDNDQPSLELPKLGLRRRRKKDAPAPPPADDTAVDEVAVEETAVLPPMSPAPPPPPAPELVEPPPLFVDEVEPVTAVEPPRPVVVEETEPEAQRETSEPTRRARKVRAVRTPSGMVVAVLTGLVVGLGMVGLTWASLRLCETVQGTSSCGGTGYPLLAAILVLMVIVGTLLLKLGRVAEPGSTSFLAVGLTAVIALLFLVDSLLDTAMIVVIPLISAVSYAASHWVTRTFIEPAEH
jgi:hypothetical protein